uniref:Major facilitator superfamily (MFS) profile domain-containing protein n=1 Tax=Romanomermis culicivorax TaxID=13658 RepID=A0A915LBF8_ROMCU
MQGLAVGGREVREPSVREPLQSKKASILRKSDKILGADPNGLWAFIPIFSHYLLQLGYSPADLIILMGTTPFVLIFSRLLLGDYADRSTNHKLVMVSCLLISSLTIAAIYFVPALSSSDSIDEKLFDNKTEDFSLLNSTSNIANFSSVSQFDRITSNFIDDPSQDELTYDRKHPKHSHNETHFSSYQIWLVLILYVLAYPFGILPAISLADTTTLGLLKDKPQNFGKQRMWMVLGSTFSVPLNDIDSKNDTNKNQGERHSKSKKAGLAEMWPVIKQNWRIKIYLLGTFVFGLNFGQSLMLAVPHMKELGASQLWVMISVMCIGFSLLIMMFLSGKIISFLGHEFTLCMVLTLTAIRSVLWAMTPTYWIFVATEPLWGISFGMTLVNVGSYARCIAPKGAEASAQSIISSAYEGLGCGIGQMLSGSLQHSFGSAMSWTCFSIFTFVFTFLYFALLFITRKPGRNRTSPNEA